MTALSAHTENIINTKIQRKVIPLMDAEQIKAKFFSVFSDASDFAVRELDFGETKLYIAYFVGFSSREYMNKYMIEPISRAYAAREADVPLSALITNIKIEKVADFSAAKEAVLAGNAVLFGDIREDVLGISVFTNSINRKILGSNHKINVDH